MLRALTLAFVAFVTASVQAEETIAWLTDPAAARAAAQETGRPVLVFVTSSHCHYCVKLKQETFRDANIIAHVNEHFVPLQIDRGAQPALEQKLRVNSYPTVVILDAKDAEIHRSVGFVAANPLSQTFRKIEVEWLAAHPRPGTTVK